MDYVSIRVSTLRGDRKIPFNLYLHLNDKYILYIREGDSFEGERLKKMKAKKLKKMFIPSSDEGKYRSYLSENIETAFDNNSKKPIEVRAEIAQGTVQASTEDLIENIGSEGRYDRTKEDAEKYIQFLLHNGTALKPILDIENTDQNIIHHSVTVATLAISMAHKIGIKKPKQLETLAMGALLHDLGHTLHEIPIHRPLSTLTPAELETYKTHPQLGADRVRAIRHFEADVAAIILEHEECTNGSGFPNKIKESKFGALSQIVAVANRYDRFVSFEKMSSAEAVKKLLMDYLGRYSLDHMQALKNIFLERGVLK